MFVFCDDWFVNTALIRYLIVFQDTLLVTNFFFLMSFLLGCSVGEQNKRSLQPLLIRRKKEIA